MTMPGGQKVGQVASHSTVTPQWRIEDKRARIVEEVPRGDDGATQAICTAACQNSISLVLVGGPCAKREAVHRQANQRDGDLHLKSSSQASGNLPNLGKLGPSLPRCTLVPPVPDDCTPGQTNSSTTIVLCTNKVECKL